MLMLFRTCVVTSSGISPTSLLIQTSFLKARILLPLLSRVTSKSVLSQSCLQESLIPERCCRALRLVYSLTPLSPERVQPLQEEASCLSAVVELFRCTPSRVPRPTPGVATEVLLRFTSSSE